MKNPFIRFSCIVTLVLLMGVSTIRAGPEPVIVPHADGYLYNVIGDSIYFILGDSTLIISPAGIYWEPDTVLNRALVDSIVNGYGRFSGVATLENVFNYMHSDIFDTTGFNDSIGIKANGITDAMVSDNITIDEASDADTLGTKISAALANRLDNLLSDVYKYFDRTYFDTLIDASGDSIIVVFSDSALGAQRATTDKDGNEITATYETIVNVAKIGDDTANFKTAYGWGDHSAQNYLDNDDANVDTAAWNAAGAGGADSAGIYDGNSDHWSVDKAWLWSVGYGLKWTDSLKDSSGTDTGTVILDTAVAVADAEPLPVTGNAVYDWVTAQSYLTTETDPIWVSDSGDYAFKTWVQIEIEDSLNEYALTSALHTRSHAMTSSPDHTAGNDMIFYSTGAGVLTELLFGSSGTYLKSNGTGSALTWATLTGADLWDTVGTRDTAVLVGSSDTLMTVADTGTSTSIETENSAGFLFLDPVTIASTKIFTFDTAQSVGGIQGLYVQVLSALGLQTNSFISYTADDTIDFLSNLKMDSSIEVVGSIATGDTTTGDVDVYHYFSTDGSWNTEYLRWKDDSARFEVSDEFLATHLYASEWGGVGASWRIGHWGATAVPSLFFWKDGASNGAWLRFDTTTDQFEFSDDIDVTGKIQADSAFFGTIALQDGSGDTAILNVGTAFPGRLDGGQNDAQFGDSVAGKIGIGNSWFGQSSDTTFEGLLNLNQTAFWANMGSPASIEFAFFEANGDGRLVIPTSGAGYATNLVRSGMCAGPWVWHDSAVIGTYWGFDHLAMATAIDGADWGVQNNLQVQDTFFIGTGTGNDVDTFTSTTLDDYETVVEVAKIGDDTTDFKRAVDSVDLLDELTAANFWVGNVSNKRTAVTMSGDGTMDNAGAIDVTHADSTSAVYSGNVRMDTLSAPTYVTLEEWWDISQSAMIISGGAITQDASDSTVIDIAAGTGQIKKTDSDIGENVFFDFSAGDDIAVTDATELLVYIDYNGGSPIFATTAASSVTFTTQIALGRVYRNGNHMHLTQGGQNFTNFRVKNSLRIYEIYALHRGTGLVTSEGADASNDIDVSSGVFYLGNNGQALSAVESFTDGIELWYGDNAGGFTDYDTTALNDEHYDDGSGTRAALTANRYNIFWVFMYTDGELVAIYDSVTQSGGYSLAAAQAKTVVTTLPPIVASMGVFVAKIIVQEDAGITSIEFPWAITFAGALSVDHGDLPGLNQDHHTQYLKESDTAAFALTVLDAPTITTSLAMGTNKITGLGTPTAPTDAATKQYVDDSSTGVGNLSVFGDATIYGGLVQMKKSLRLNTAHAYATNAADWERFPVDTNAINITETADTFCAVDPSEVYFENGSFFGYKIAGVHTPIPTTAGNDSAVYENPMFYVCKDYDSIPTFLNIGTDTLNYEVLTIDSFAPGPGPYDTVTHLSDCKLNPDADGILWMYVRVTMGGITWKVIAGYFDTTGGPHFVWKSDGGDTLWTGLEAPGKAFACTSIVAANTFTYRNAAIITAKADTVRVSWTSPASATTVAMVCDSMVKYINDDAGYSARYTAYDSTTFYVIECKTGHANWFDSVDANQDTSTHVEKVGNSDRLMITPAFVTDTSRSYAAFVSVGGNPGGNGRDMLRYQSTYPCSGFVMTDSIDMPDAIPLNFNDSNGMVNHIDVTVASPSDWLLCAAVTNTAHGSAVGLHGGEMWIFHSYDRGYTWQDSVYVMQFNPDDTEWDSKYIYGWDVTSIEEYGDGYLLRVVYSAKDSANSYWHSGRTIIYLGQDTTETNLTTYVTNAISSLDSTNAATKGFAVSNINMGQQIIYPSGPVGGAGSAGPGDSTRLELSSHDGKAHVLYKDSSIAGGAGPWTDSAYTPFQIPSWASKLDSVIIIMKGKHATADSAEVSKLEVFGPSQTGPAVYEDSSYYASTTARNTTSIARYSYPVDNSQFQPGDVFNVMIEKTLGANVNGVVYMYRVFCKVSQ